MKTDDDGGLKLASLQRKLDESIANGASHFVIPSGVHTFDGVDLIADGAQDLVISGHPAGSVTLLFSCNFGVVLRSCTNVSVHNITVGYVEPCYSQGSVTGKGKGTITYTVDAGFPTLDSPPMASRLRSLIVKVISWDPVTKLKIGVRLLNHSIPVRKLGPRSFEIGAGAEIGNIVTVGPRAGHTLLLTNCSRCGVLGVTIHGTSDMALVEYGGGGANVWRGNRVVRNETQSPMGLLASIADVFQSSGCEHGPLVQDNELSFAGDDCMNIHNYLSVVMRNDALDKKRVLVLDAVGEAALTGEGFPFHQDLNTFARVRVGDVARVYDKHLGLSLATAVTAHEEADATTCQPLANETLQGMGFRAGTRAWVGRVFCYWVTLRDEIPESILPRAYVNIDRPARPLRIFFVLRTRITTSYACRVETGTCSVPGLPHTVAHIDRLSNPGAIVRNNSLHDCGGLRFKSIGGQVLGNRLHRTVGIEVVMWPVSHSLRAKAPASC